MRISIVIPTKNEEQYLPKLLTSIQQQTEKDYEVIVADAGSTDHTREVATQFGAQVVEGGMPGPGRNCGAREAKGDIIIFFDADVILPDPNFLKDCLTEFENRQVDVATCRVQALEGSGLDHALHGVYNLYTIATEHVLPHAPGFCMIVRRTAHEAIHGFDEEVVFAEDHDYMRRAKKMGYRFGILRAHKIPVSVRRMKKEGRFQTAVNYVFTEWHMLQRGSIKQRSNFRYKWKGVQDKPSDET